MGLAALLGLFMDLSFFITNMITMIGLAVGIDYSLFIVTRFRQLLHEGLSPQDAAAEAGASAGRAVIFAGVTVGGLGTAYGALVGCLLVGLVIQLSTLFVPTELKSVGALVILILVLLVRPQGILGRRERIG